jgi:hypothetical protein
MQGRTWITGAFALTLVALFLAGCASGPRIITNSDPAADWSSYRTFGFFDQLSTDRGNVRSLMSNQVRSLMSNQLIESTKREMQAAGFAFAESNPDLMVNFVVSTRETIQTRPSSAATMHHSRGRYGTWSGWNTSLSTTEVVQRTEGTLAVDIVDRARNQLVWEGAATKSVTDSTRRNQEQVLDEAIAEIFAQFP